MGRRALLIHEHIVEREGEEVWALWEEVGSRGLDTWTGLPAMEAIPDSSAQNPAEALPVLWERRKGCARCCATVAAT